jgi:hypothetical protein
MFREGVDSDFKLNGENQEILKNRPGGEKLENLPVVVRVNSS